MFPAHFRYSSAGGAALTHCSAFRPAPWRHEPVGMRRFPAPRAAGPSGRSEPFTPTGGTPVPGKAPAGASLRLGERSVWHLVAGPTCILVSGGHGNQRFPLQQAGSRWCEDRTDVGCRRSVSDRPGPSAPRSPGRGTRPWRVGLVAGRRGPLCRRGKQGPAGRVAPGVCARCSGAWPRTGPG